MAKAILVLVMVIHGLIHLMGVMKAFQLAEMKQLTLPIAKPAGVLWFLASMLFVAAAVALLSRKDWWWMIAGPAIVLSQVLIVASWKDARFGTVANLIILAGAVVGFGTWGFQSMVKRELRAFTPASATAEKRPVTQDRLAGLPANVRTWLERSNIIGKEFIATCRLKQTGEMRTTPAGKWMPFEAEQWFRIDQPGFIWVADVRAAPGIRLAGRDSFLGGKGHMLIKLLSLVPVADVKGTDVDHAALTRFLAETVWFPSAALRDYIQWDEVDATSAMATMTYGGTTACGVFQFDEKGDVAGFEARRHYQRKGGSTLEDWQVKIDSDSFREFQGVRIPVRSEVVWKLEEGDFAWFRLEISGVHYY